MSNTQEKVKCSDCGQEHDRSTMHWGHNSWNMKRVTDAEYAWVCEGCWNVRSFTAMTRGMMRLPFEDKK